MQNVKIILLIIAIVCIAIQFIRPARNQNGQVSTADIVESVTVPDSIRIILANACYDCHSNNTRYPWYATVQPISWLMASHINKGKEELNFSEFGNYSARRKISKMNGIANSIKDDNMPLRSYKLMHKNAQLSSDEKRLIFTWAQQLKDSLSTKN